jgi:hypothetical protein
VSLAAAIGHLLAGPARTRRLQLLNTTDHHPSPAVPVPAPATTDEADEAIR